MASSVILQYAMRNSLTRSCQYYRLDTDQGPLKPACQACDAAELLSEVSPARLIAVKALFFPGGDELVFELRVAIHGHQDNPGFSQ